VTANLETADKAWRDRRHRHWTMLCVACFVLAMSLVLQVQHGEQVAFAGRPDLPLPGMCLSYSLFGMKCPGCGLTRSFIYLAHGDLQSSLRMHRVGWILALALLLQIPYRIASLLRPGREVLGLVIPRLFGHLLIALLIGNWLQTIIADRLP